MFHRLLPVSIACAIAVTAAGITAQEAPPAKKGETRLVVTGCLKGRVLAATRNPDEKAEVVTGPDVVGKSFRIAGPKDVINEVKKYQGDLVEVTGTVRTSELAEKPGFNMGGTRVTVGMAPGTDPSRPGSMATTPVYSVILLDATALRFLSSGCPIGKR
jgi:hypothetical protein